MGSGEGPHLTIITCKEGGSFSDVLDESKLINSLTKQFNVDFLERVDTAELVQLMMNLIEDEGLVVVCREVLHDIIYW